MGSGEKREETCMVKLGQNVHAKGQRGAWLSGPEKLQLGALGKTGVAATNQFHLFFLAEFTKPSIFHIVVLMRRQSVGTRHSPGEV